MRQPTTHSSMIEVERSEKQLHVWSNYTFKFAHNGTKEYQTFLDYHFLPNSKLPVTWESSGFWIVEPIQQQIKFNGEDQEVIVKRKRAAWIGYIRSFAGDQIPEFETKDYRHLTNLEALLDDLIQESELYHSH